MVDLIPASKRPSVAFFSTNCGQVLKIYLLDYQMSICGQYIYIYICIYVYMYICIYVYMYICIYVYMYICIYVYMYIFLILRAPFKP